MNNPGICRAGARVRGRHRGEAGSLHSLRRLQDFNFEPSAKLHGLSVNCGRYFESGDLYKHTEHTRKTPHELADTGWDVNRRLSQAKLQLFWKLSAGRRCAPAGGWVGSFLCPAHPGMSQRSSWVVLFGVFSNRNHFSPSF